MFTVLLNSFYLQTHSSIIFPQSWYSPHVQLSIMSMGCSGNITIFPLSSFWHTLTYDFSFMNRVIHTFYLTYRLCHERNNPSGSNIVHRWNILNKNLISFSLEPRWIILRTKKISEWFHNSLHYSLNHIYITVQLYNTHFALWKLYFESLKNIGEQPKIEISQNGFLPWRLTFLRAISFIKHKSDH